MTKTCEEYSTTRKGICGRPLDEHGDHLADRDEKEA